MLSRSRMLCTRRLMSSEAVKKGDPKKVEVLKGGPIEDAGKFPGMPLHKVNLLDKQLLVWAGYYKTRDDVPPKVDHHQINKARDKGRVRGTFVMMGISFFACIGMAWWGKHDQRQGKSIAGMNQEWHRKINEDHQRNQGK